MTLKKIKNFLLTIFNEDYLQNNREYSYITQIIIITIKSLMPSANLVGSQIDYKRYEKELELWYYYRNGDNISLLNSISYLDEIIYWEEIDDTAYRRVTPIVLANSEWSIIKEEVIKNILYTTGNISTLLEGMLLSKILYLLMKDENMDVLEALKEETINFSQTDFIEKYSKFYKVPIKKYPGNYAVEFERNKISMINILNGMENSEFSTIKDILLNKENTYYGKAIQNLKNIKKHPEYEDYFYEDMCDYLYKLRKGQIRPETLKIKKYYLPDIFNLDTGDEFFHSLLNNSKVLKKEEGRDKILVYVKSKSGVYKFYKDKRPSKR